MATKKTASKPPIKRKVEKQEQVLLPTHFIQAGFWAQHLVPALVLAGIAALLYAITVSFGYLLDDQIFIWDNSFVQKGFAGLAEIFGHDSLLGYYKDPALMLEGGRYRPLPLASFALEVGLFGKDSAGAAHFVNVVVYALSCLLLYRVLVALIPSKPEQLWYFSIPFITTLIFALHPLHVEVVANIKSRDEMFAFLGSFGALWAMLKYFDTQENRWRWMAALYFLLGLLSKENTATFLAVIPLTVWMFSKLPFGRIAAACAPMLGALLVFFLLRSLALETALDHPDELVLNPFFGMSIAEKMATIFLSLGWYVKLLLVPHPLTIDYYPYHVPKVSLSDWRAILSLLAYLGMGFWAYRQLRKPRGGETSGWVLPAYGLLYFLLTISVVSNVFVRTSTFLNERYLFMPSVGFCLIMGWFIVQKLPEWMQKPAHKLYVAGIALTTALVILFGIRSWTRIQDWSGDGSNLVESALKVSGESYRANYYYANMLYQNKYKNLEKATDPVSVAERNALITEIEPYLDKSLAINPGYRLATPLKVQFAVAHFNQDKNLDKMLKEFEQLILAQPTNGEMLTMVLDVLKALKGADPNVYNFFCHRVGYNFYFVKMQDAEGALEFLNLALTNYPQDKNTMQDLVQVYGAMGNQAKVREMQQRLGGR